ncbi:hypothetical protein SH528x_002199 [Novipirellula sp. SH528]|uniref:hypothetical protein n=1 Tax=Novipirellula sp. SH528 TaxID=3454466 RepID=UPI003F9EFB84
MLTKNDNDNALAHGAGAGLLALLGMFGRCADDVARIGVNSVDDVGRACIRSTDDIGSLMSRSGDDLLRPIDDFHTANYIDDLRFEPSTPRIVLNESDEGVSNGPHVAKEVAEATFKIIDLNDNENDK